MGQHRDFNHLDPFYASWADAIQEFIGNAVLGLRLSCPDNTTVRATAGSGSAQVGVGLSGRWRYRTAPYDRTVSGTAGVKDVFVVAVSDNDFSGSLPIPQDPDGTVYDWELRVVASGDTPTSVALHRKVGELDWDGSKITGLRQTVGAGDQTLPAQPKAPRPDAPALKAQGASGQVADIIQVLNSAGTVLFSIEAGGKLKPASRPDYTTTGISTNRSIDPSTITGNELVDVLGTLIADLQTLGLTQ